MNDDIRRIAYLKRFMETDDVPTSTNVTQPSSIHHMQDSQSGIQTQNGTDLASRTLSTGINDQKLMQSLGVPEVVTTKLETLTQENEELKSKIERISNLSMESISKIHELECKLKIARLNNQMMNAGVIKNYTEDKWFENPTIKKEEEKVEELRNQLASTKNPIQKTLIKNEIETIKKRLKHIQDDKEEIFGVIGSLSNKYYPSLLINDNKIQLLEHIGCGGFANVWKAFDYEQGIVVAVKITNMFSITDFLKHSTYLKREHDIMEATNSKNVVNIFRWFNLGDDKAIVMEYCENGDLDNLMKKHGKFSEVDAHSILTQVIDGLASLKSKESGSNEVVIHYDLKPANILFDKDLTPKIADFGLSKISDDGRSLQLTTMGGGTLGYSAPETYNGSKKISSSADTWSLGIIYYEMLTSDMQLKKTLRSGADIKTCLKEKDGTKKPSSNLSDAAKQFIITCLERDPEKRPNIKKLQNDPYIKNVPVSTPKKRSRSKEKLSKA